MQSKGHSLPPFLPEDLNHFLINAAVESLAELLHSITASAPSVWQVACRGFELTLLSREQMSMNKKAIERLYFIYILN